MVLVDCREGSPTLHNKVELHFKPSPIRYLIIPPGVAHAFKNLENIFTVNRPRLLLNSKGNYIPKNDVIDWPLSNYNYPILKPNKILADIQFYQKQAEEQKKFINTLKSSDYYATPISRLYTDPASGKKYKVTLNHKKEV
ncbi:dTDP-4-dehydrorhamnose 3,5-epimerase family protein [Pigmentibacter ruber]|uniref:dTDP-4-dehydrorhamnose 3,5-epimerase family protein n=1 Tax=Pigmentibacter ruber TaxID=2683196 RepID=UPI0022A7FA8D|nr:dTDP-4-dehydrorhamnose 3,5-epimerase family protein [Pigmentibacter ruber]